MTTTADAAEKLLELLAVVAVGELVIGTGDSEIRRTYARMMAQCVAVRDSAPPLELKPEARKPEQRESTFAGKATR